jgi:hypothetical protein
MQRTQKGLNSLFFSMSCANPVRIAESQTFKKKEKGNDKRISR